MRSFFSFIDHLGQFSSDLYNNNNNIPLRACFRDNPDNPVSECKTVLDFAAARDDEDTGGDNRVTTRMSCQLKSPTSAYCITYCTVTCPKKQFLTTNLKGTGDIIEN